MGDSFPLRNKSIWQQWVRHRIVSRTSRKQLKMKMMDHSRGLSHVNMSNQNVTDVHNKTTIKEQWEMHLRSRTIIHILDILLLFRRRDGHSTEISCLLFLSGQKVYEEVIAWRIPVWRCGGGKRKLVRELNDLLTSECLRVWDILNSLGFC